MKDNHNIVRHDGSYSVQNLHSSNLTLNEPQRRKEAYKIAFENSQLIKRLQNPKPMAIDNKVILKDNLRYMKARKNMQKYDFYADPFKREKSVDNMMLNYSRIQVDSPQVNLSLQQNNSQVGLIQEYDQSVDVISEQKEEDKI